MSSHTESSAADLFFKAAPLLFVVIWATGFIVARLVAPHADPLTFLCARYVLAISVLLVVALAVKAPWPKTGREVCVNAVSGVLLHGVYLGGVFWSVRHGLPAGFAGLLAGLQPLLTALVAAPLLGEKVGPLRWCGIALGFAGAILVLLPKMGTGVDAVPPTALGVGFLAVLAFTAGTIWQKRTGGRMDLRTGNVIQFSAALVPTAIVAWLTEEGKFDLSPDLWIGLLWSVFGLSFGAILLLLLLIKRGAVVQTASLLYLVPAVTALMAWAFFGETMNAIQIGGMVLAAFGVAMATRQ